MTISLEKRVVSSLKEDEFFNDFDFDSFEKEFSAVIKEHGSALDELSERYDQILGENMSFLYNENPEDLKREILQDELQTVGIDWERFHAGKQDEYEAVNKHLKGLDLSFTAADILSGKAFSVLSKETHDQGEAITLAQAKSLEGLTGNAIKTFVIQRARIYQSLKGIDPSDISNFFHVVTSMMQGGLFSWGERGARAALRTLGTGASIGTAIAAGITAIGGLAAVVALASTFFFLLWFAVLIFSKASILVAVVNRTPHHLLFEDPYILHGEDNPTMPKTIPLTGGPPVSALQGVYIKIPGVGEQTAMFVGYYFSKGNIGFVGVNGAFRIKVVPPSGGGNTGLMSGYHIYNGYAFLKFGGTHILTDITTDTSSESFYKNNRDRFVSGPTRNSNGEITVSSKLNAYPSNWSTKNLYELTIVKDKSFA